ncbi:MAG: hypothetical protein HY849_00370 [Nitrosomonadales bacterium]|nr:hypothetical protein [Nitrosomonadales bacterium]
MSCLLPSVDLTSISRADLLRLAPESFPYAKPAARHTTCHFACECREQKFAVLIKAALDTAKELDDLQSIVPNLTDELRDVLRAVVERTYAAVEALGVEIGGHDEPHPPHRQCGCNVCAASFEEEDHL